MASQIKRLEAVTSALKRDAQGIETPFSVKRALKKGFVRVFDREEYKAMTKCNGKNSGALYDVFTEFNESFKTNSKNLAKEGKAHSEFMDRIYPSVFTPNPYKDIFMEEIRPFIDKFG